jgi:hypothetical protein
LGYRYKNGTWQPSDHTVLFVGDFIDRGPDQIETLGIVRRMVSEGGAQAANI